MPFPAPPGPGLRSARPGGPPSALRVPPRAAPLQAGPRARPLPWPPGSRAPPPVQVSLQRLAASRTKPESRAESRAARTRPPRPSPAPGAPPRLRPPRRAPISLLTPSAQQRLGAAFRGQRTPPPRRRRPALGPGPPFAGLSSAPGPSCPDRRPPHPLRSMTTPEAGQGPSHAPGCAAERQSRCGTEGRLPLGRPFPHPGSTNLGRAASPASWARVSTKKKHGTRHDTWPNAKVLNSGILERGWWQR